MPPETGLRVPLPLVRAAAGIACAALASFTGAAAYVYWAGATLGRHELHLAGQLLLRAPAQLVACGALLGLVADPVRRRLPGLPGALVLIGLSAAGGGLVAATFFDPLTQVDQKPALVACAAAWSAGMAAALAARSLRRAGPARRTMAR